MPTRLAHSRSSRSRRRPARIAAALLVLCCCAAPGLAQRLAPDPVSIEGTGVTLRLPEGSAAQTSSFGNTGSARVALPDRLGEIDIQSRRTADTTLDAAAITASILRQLTTAGGRVLARPASLTIAGQPAQRFYIRTATERPDVIGYTVLVPEPGRVLTFELVTPVPRFEAARELYEASLATAVLRDSEAVATRRAAAVRAGERFLESLTPEDYRQAINAYTERWERLYLPSDSGTETERGYRRIRAWEGAKGELQPDKPEANYNADDATRGWLLRVDARLLDDGYIVDTEAIYFLSPDRDTEAWTVRMAIKRDGATSRWTEIGARSGRSITVQTEDPAGGTRIARPTIDGAAYLSTLETYLLPPRLASLGAPTDYAFISYQTQSGQARLRTDTLAPANQGWTLTTTLSDNDAAQVARLDQRGTPRRTTLPNASVWEPTEFDQLLRLWRTKGLPLD
ncbi:MAG: hypothetical protein AAF356_00475 [Planctomycetota bacterium]